MAPLPARILEGTCDALGDVVVDLLVVVAGAPADAAHPTVYASISDLAMPLAAVATASRVLIVGGESDPASAVACGALAGAPQGPADLAIVLAPLHSSSYSGTALLHEVDGRTWVYLVVVSDPRSATPEGSPRLDASPAPSAAPDASLAPGDLSPIRSAEPGSSGAPAFSPLAPASEVP
jgi:hypothetical protein